MGIPSGCSVLFAQEVPKMATLEGYKIGLNKSGRKALLIKLKKCGSKISLQ